MHWLDVAVHEGDKILVTPHIFNNSHKLRQKMKKIILSILGTSLLFGSYAQSNLNVEPTATYLKYRSGRFYTVENPNERGTDRIKGQQLKKILIETDAYDSWQMHRAFKITTTMFAVTTVGLATWSLIKTINSGGDPWELDDANMISTYALGTLVLLEVPSALLQGSFGRKTAKRYNSYVDSKGTYSLGLGVTRNGVGLILKF